RCSAQEMGGPALFQPRIGADGMEQQQCESARIQVWKFSGQSRAGRGSFMIPIETRRPDGVDAPSILTQKINASGALLSGGKMDVRQLGDGGAEGIITLAERSIAAVNMRHDAMR